MTDLGRRATAGALTDWANLDWRFLLRAVAPTARWGGDARIPWRDALGLLAPGPVAAEGQGSQGDLDLLVLRDPAVRSLPDLLSRLRPGGQVYVEVRRRAWRSGPRSLPGWQRALTSAGIVDVQAHWHAPALDTRSRIVPLSSRSAVADALSHHQEVRFGGLVSAAARLLLAAGLFPLLVREGSVSGRRVGGDVDDAPVIDRALRDDSLRSVLRAEGISAVSGVALLTPSYATSRHVLVLVYAGSQHGPRLLLKIPRRPGDDSGVRHEAGQLQRVHELGAEVAPKPLGVFPIGATVALAETAVRGRPLSPREVRAHPQAALAAGLELVRALPVTGRWRAEEIEAVPTGGARSVLVSLLGAEAADQVVARTRRALHPLRDAALPAVLEHGDLSHPNLLLGSEGRLRAVDWERGASHGLPGQDLVLFLAYLAEARAGAASPLERVAAVEGALLSRHGWARGHLAEHLAWRGVEERLLLPVLLACWVRASGTLPDRLTAGGGDEQELRTVAASERDVMLWMRLLPAVGGETPE